MIKAVPEAGVTTRQLAGSEAAQVGLRAMRTTVTAVEEEEEEVEEVCELKPESEVLVTFTEKVRTLPSLKDGLPCES